MVLDSISEKRVNAFSESLQSGQPLYITSSKVSDFTDLAVAMLEVEPPNQVNVLTDSKTIKDVRRRFLTASHIEDFVEQDQVEIRSLEQNLPTFILAGSELVTVTGIEDSLLETFTKTESPFVDDTLEEIKRKFEAGEIVPLRAPAYSNMLQDLGKELDDTMRTDVETMLEKAQVTRDDESDIDPVRISILAAAKNEVQMYELSRWGEYSGVASRSKYSREKTRLEDLGIIATEKVQTGVGRPRQRLVLADDVSETSIENLLSLTESILV